MIPRHEIYTYDFEELSYEERVKLKIEELKREEREKDRYQTLHRT